MSQRLSGPPVIASLLSRKESGTCSPLMQLFPHPMLQNGPEMLESLLPSPFPSSETRDTSRDHPMCKSIPQPPMKMAQSWSESLDASSLAKVGSLLIPVLTRLSERYYSGGGWGWVEVQWDSTSTIHFLSLPVPQIWAFQGHKISPQCVGRVWSRRCAMEH